MGANSRSTVGTATDANAMLRVLFSRLGRPHVGSANALSFNVSSVRGVGQISIDKGAGKTEKRAVAITGGMCPRCEGMGAVTDIDLSQLARLPAARPTAHHVVGRRAAAAQARDAPGF